MAFWIIAGVVLVALAPLSHFWPSKHQRRLAHIREQAALLGLYVELRKLPAHRKIDIYIPADDRRYWVYYGLRCSQKVKLPVGSWLRTPDGWFALTGDSDLPDALVALPEGLDVVSSTPGSVGFFWQERGGEEVLEHAARCLKQAVASASTSLDESEQASTKL
jgi:hypothetical protein